MPEKPEIYHAYLMSPVGPVEVRADDMGVLSVYFLDGEIPAGGQNTNAVAELCVRELEEYFARKRQTFTVPLHAEGTGFQQKVWEQLSLLPYGKAVSYLDISKALGDPNLTRAVGLANGKNPISIIVPCHRVIGADGSLTGYAGGMHRKKWLLMHEGIITQQELF